MSSDVSTASGATSEHLRGGPTDDNSQRQQRRRGGMGALALPNFSSRVLSASAVVAYVAVGAAAILSRSVTEAARDALAWVLSRDGKGRQPKQYFGRTSR